MSRYEILESGVVVNTIIASTEFVESNYSEYRLLAKRAGAEPEETPESVARVWRDEELVKTDALAVLPDHPNAANLLTYRAALRNWPSTSDFPATKPVLG